MIAFTLWLFGAAATAFFGSTGFGAAATAFALAFTAATATAALVDVAVGDFFFSRRANFLDRHVEVQVLARERVVAVDSDFVAFDFDDADRDRPLIGARLKLHAGLEIFHALETVLGHDLLKRGIWLAVAVGWSDAHVGAVTGFFTDESGFEAWNNVTMSVEIRQWLPWLGLIDQSSFVIFKSVVHGDYCAFCDLHNLLVLWFLRYCGREEVANKSRSSKKKGIYLPAPFRFR